MRGEKAKRFFTPAELRQRLADKQLDGLCNQASLFYFEKWYAFGGQQRGMTPTEILDTPAWLLTDFSLILSYIHEEREAIERVKPKKTSAKRR